MILSRGRGYLFIHVPKTGGTSMALALEARAKADDQMLGDTPKARKRRKRFKGVQAAGRLWKHSTLRDLQGVVTDDDLDHLMIFTLVRNPWDRMVSYYHWLRSQSFDHPAAHLARAVEFSQFVQHPQTQSSFRHNSYANYVTDWHGLDRGVYVRLEHLEKDLKPVENHLGFSLRLPHVNQSERTARYQEAYDPASMRVVTDVCGEDIERFGYQFEPNSPSLDT